MAGEYTLQGALVRRGEPPDVPYDKGIDQRKKLHAHRTIKAKSGGVKIGQR